MKKRIYLAGLISTDQPESFSWRKEFSEKLLETWTGRAHFEVLDPTRQKDSEDLLYGGLVTRNMNCRAVVLRDYNDIRVSDILVAHLGNFGGSRDPLGTVCEMAWAWEKRIPVLAITDTASFVMRHHPFVREFATEEFENVDSAVRYILKFLV